ncbi:NUAK family SNF1-like kinase 1 [Papilio machaon]|uniref:NUAK family SNF1-like kinase 1 n=1 Tax=Papilio machaon TaxID=76193 RepID=A0A194R0G1_PAPMA|nr:NUAK family SNF1-like kinase 1 [Papilio machaon]
MQNESEADLVRIRREVQIMSSVRHPNIVHIYEVFENSEKMILVMEYCSGGELYDYLSQKKVLEEEEARRLFRQIATAVYYCHIHKICHRDLKLENVLLDDTGSAKICHRDLKLENVLLDDTGSAKIADFGLSNVFKETSLLSTFCGSPLYASPEIVKGTPYIGPEVDCWSLGVLLYTLVYGAMPFDGSNFKRLVRQISNGDYYEPKNPSTASPLIRDMLTVDPLKRADIAYICDHPWVNSGCPSSCLDLAQALAAETPVRLDLLLSLAPAAASHTNSVVVPTEAELGPEESCADLTSSTSIPVEPSNSAEKRILELVAEGGEDAIKPSPTRTIVSAGDNKRKLELAMSASGLHRKKEKVASCASVAQLPAALPEEGSLDSPPADEDLPTEPPQPCLKSSATMTIAPAPVELAKDATVDIAKKMPKEEEINDKPRPTTNKVTSPKIEEKSPFEKQEEIKAELGPEESCTDLTSSTSIPVEPSNSAEKRILELVAEGGEDAIKPSPTRTIVSAGDNKRKLELAMSASGLHRKKEKVASCASVAQLPAALPEEGSLDSPPADEDLPTEPPQPCLKSSATMTITPAPVELAKDATVDIAKKMPKEEEINDKPRPTTNKVTSPKIEEKSPFEKQEEIKVEEQKPASVATTTDKLTSLSLTQPTPAAAPTPTKPKKLSIGGHVGSFKEQFERRASLTSAPEIKRNVSKPVVSKIAKAKAQSEDRDLPAKSPDNGTVRLQQIGIEPSQVTYFLLNW